MPRPKLLDKRDYYTLGQICKLLSMSKGGFIYRLKIGYYDPPTKTIDGTRYFDEAWLKRAKSP